jgi:hypothetical protein
MKTNKHGRNWNKLSLTGGGDFIGLKSDDRNEPLIQLVAALGPSRAEGRVVENHRPKGAFEDR